MTYFTVRFGVVDTLVDGGFNPTPEMFKEMIEHVIPEADIHQTTAERIIDDTDFDLSDLPSSGCCL